MQMTIAGVSERLVYSVLAVFGLGALETAMAVSGGQMTRGAAAAALTYAAYRFVYKAMSNSLVAACNAAAGLAIVHAVIAYESIPLHPYLLVEVAMAALLAGVVKDLRGGE
jgi:hypothetical protein